ncbi:MAG: hypothetical protein N3I35_03170 [Clostridia bacterium]|nr:hypothetical protein [Clostridia bacterium]
MLFIIIAGVILIGYAFLIFRRSQEPKEYSKIVLIGLIISVISTIALSNNYIVNLITPPVNDGIAITNNLAYWIIGEGNWTKDLFKKAYDTSTAISFVLLVLYAVMLFLEKKKIVK